MATHAQKIGLAAVNEGLRETRKVAVKTVTITVVDGAAAGTYELPAGAVVTTYNLETSVAVPGSPTNTNFRLGSSANGQQYIADVDAKAQGFLTPTVVYAGRNPATTSHFTVASSGGTAGSQDATLYLHVHYLVPAA